jgi:hypothetical protein
MSHSTKKPDPNESYWEWFKRGPLLGQAIVLFVLFMMVSGVVESCNRYGWLTNFVDNVSGR